MACEEMQLYYAYLDAVEEAKRKAQPWQCEVTLIPDSDEADSKPAAKVRAKAANSPSSKSASSGKSASASSGFVCDDPE
jgi:hypothetical protein